MNEMAGVWLSISEYSQYKNVSISTIRRHIKNNILKYKEESGKYFIYVHSTEKIKLKEEEELLRVKLELELYKTKNRILRDENSELKMLVSLYEGQLLERKHEQPPEFELLL